MIKTRLAAALSFALLVATNATSAVYQVVELPLADKGVNNFPVVINNNSESIVNIQRPFNVPIDLSFFDFENEDFLTLLVDPDGAKVGDFHISDYTNLLNTIASGQGTQAVQQIANITSYRATTNGSDFIPGFSIRNQDDVYMLDTNTTIRDLSDTGMAVGSGQSNFYKLDFTFTLETTNDDETITETDITNTYVVNDFQQRGFVDFNGQVIGLPPTDTTFGGVSNALGVNNQNQVVGFGTTAFEDGRSFRLSDGSIITSDDLRTSYDNCLDDEIRGDIPVESCAQNLNIRFSTSMFNTFGRVRALLWQLDDDGNLVETRELESLFTAEVDDTNIYVSNAVAINDNGIAVGQSSNGYDYRGTTLIGSFAVVYTQDEVINITPEVDEDTFLLSLNYSTSTGINNNNLAIGYQNKFINSAVRTKPFIYDVNTAELEFIDDFFFGSASVPLAINNNDQVVGYGQIESTQGPRRTAGFIYNHNTKDFLDLNTLLSCDAAYTVVQANGINDSGEILATALVERPERDAMGNIVFDVDGNEFITEHVISVQLNPIANGVKEECETVNDNITALDRQGAGSLWLVFLGLSVFGFRRIRLN